jgi:predicted protein tyrosine phosphatase
VVVDDYFAEIVRAFPSSGEGAESKVGDWPVVLVDAASMCAFGKAWLEERFPQSARNGQMRSNSGGRPCVPNLNVISKRAMPKPRNLLFICSQNKLRSPTAEHVFSQHPGIETMSAGTNNDAETPIDGEMVDWADVIFVMERAHLNKLRSRFRMHLGSKRVVCLDIPDDYDYMDPALVRVLKAKVGRYI